MVGRAGLRLSRGLRDDGMLDNTFTFQRMEETDCRQVVVEFGCRSLVIAIRSVVARYFEWWYGIIFLSFLR
jgi:hypothetical protein